MEGVPEAPWIGEENRPVLSHCFRFRSVHSACSLESGILCNEMDIGLLKLSIQCLN